jgi:hypothetical protein
VIRYPMRGGHHAKCHPSFYVNAAGFARRIGPGCRNDG